MKKEITVKGYCPVHNCNTSIDVTYVSRIDYGFDKQRFYCELRESDNLCKNASKCPLFNDAKETIA